MKLKEEIRRTIGDTKASKQRVWHKLQVRKRKNYKPLIISVAMSLLACIIIAIQFLPHNDTVVTIEAPAEHSSSIAFKIVHDQDGSSMNILSEQLVLTAFSQQELDNWLHYFEIEMPAQPFDEYFYMIAQFLSDGCGLEVTKLSRKSNTLDLRLQMPEQTDVDMTVPKHLNNKKEMMCTAISMPNVQVLQVKRFEGAEALQRATFNGVNRDIAINELNINDQFYNFSSVVDYLELDRMTVNNGIVLDDEKSLEIMTNAIFRAEKEPGMLNIASYDYVLVAHHKNGEQLRIDVAIDKEQQQVLFVSERNDEQGFLLSDEYAQKVIQLLQ